MLAWFPDDDLRRALTQALRTDAAGTRVAAGDALTHLQAQDVYSEIVDVLLPIARDEGAGALRRYAGTVLARVPGGVEALYQPIQDGLDPVWWTQGQAACAV